MRLTLHIMTYVDAAIAPLRKTGQIKIHSPAAVEGMRKAGRLAATCLDLLASEINPASLLTTLTAWFTNSDTTTAPPRRR
jgi:hypothetical protein